MAAGMEQQAEDQDPAADANETSAEGKTDQVGLEHALEEKENVEAPTKNEQPILPAITEVPQKVFFADSGPTAEKLKAIEELKAAIRAAAAKPKPRRPETEALLSMCQCVKSLANAGNRVMEDLADILPKIGDEHFVPLMGITRPAPPKKIEQPVEAAGGAQRFIGRVKSYNTRKGFGFVALAGFPRDIFVYNSHLIGRIGLLAGEAVQFELLVEGGRPQARQVRVVSNAVANAAGAVTDFNAAKAEGNGPPGPQSMRDLALAMAAAAAEVPTTIPEAAAKVQNSLKASEDVLYDRIKEAQATAMSAKGVKSIPGARKHRMEGGGLSLEEAAAAMRRIDGKFLPGARIRVQGFPSPEIDGCLGTVGSYEESTSRYEVSVDTLLAKYMVPEGKGQITELSPPPPLPGAGASNALRKSASEALRRLGQIGATSFPPQQQLGPGQWSQMQGPGGMGGGPMGYPPGPGRPLQDPSNNLAMLQQQQRMAQQAPGPCAGPMIRPNAPQGPLGRPFEQQPPFGGPNASMSYPEAARQISPGDGQPGLLANRGNKLVQDLLMPPGQSLDMARAAGPGMSLDRVMQGPIPTHLTGLPGMGPGGMLTPPSSLQPSLPKAAPPPLQQQQIPPQQPPQPKLSNQLQQSRLLQQQLPPQQLQQLQQQQQLLQLQQERPQGMRPPAPTPQPAKAAGGDQKPVTSTPEGRPGRVWIVLHSPHFKDVIVRASQEVTSKELRRIIPGETCFQRDYTVTLPTGLVRMPVEPDGWVTVHARHINGPTFLSEVAEELQPGRGGTGIQRSTLREKPEGQLLPTPPPPPSRDRVYSLQDMLNTRLRLSRASWVSKEAPPEFVTLRMLHVPQLKATASSTHDRRRDRKERDDREDREERERLRALRKEAATMEGLHNSEQRAIAQAREGPVVRGGTPKKERVQASPPAAGLTGEEKKTSCPTQ